MANARARILFRITRNNYKHVLIQDCEDSEVHIVGSRFVLQGANIRSANDEAALVQQLRAICHASKYDVTVFHPYFIYFDQVGVTIIGQTMEIPPPTGRFNIHSKCSCWL